MSNILRSIEEASKIVRNGGVIVYPTDTVYGIGCQPFDVNAVNKVMSIKGREKKPSPVLVCDIEQLYSVAVPTDEEVSAAVKLWPGPVTIVMKKHPNVPSEVTAGEKTIGVRMPANIVALQIMKSSGYPLLGTSANISGLPPATSVENLDAAIAKRVDVVVDGGRTLYGRPSTVISIYGGKVKVLREGVLTLDEIMARLQG